MECRGSRKGLPDPGGCIPFEYNPQGWPLGTVCQMPNCGAWLCNNPDHSYEVDFLHFGKKYSKLKICRDCYRKAKEVEFKVKPSKM